MSSPIKRKHEQNSLNLYASKKHEKEKPCYIDKLAVETGGHIFSYLPLKDLLNCGTVCSIFSFYVLGGRCYEALMSSQHLNLKYSFSQCAHNPAKANFILNFVLKKFLKKVAGENSSFEGYVDFSIIQEGVLQLFTRIRDIFAKNSSCFDKEYSGDLVIQSIEAQTRKKPLDLKDFKAAINKNGTFASYVAFKVFREFGEEVDTDSESITDLALLSAEKKDYKTLEKLGSCDATYSYYDQGFRHPPILWKRAKTPMVFSYYTSPNNSFLLENEEKILKSYEEAYKSYGDNIPPFFLFDYGRLKALTHQKKAAKELLQRCLKSYNLRVPGGVLKKIGKIYQSFNENEMALKLYKQAYLVADTRSYTRFPISFECFNNKTLIVLKSKSITEFSSKLNQSTLTECFFKIDKITKRKNKLLEKIAHIYFEEGKLKKSIKYYEKAIENYEACAKKINGFYYPLDIYHKLGNAFFEFGDFNKAHEYYKKSFKEIMEENEVEISSKVKKKFFLKRIAESCQKLGKFKKAFRYYTKALSQLEAGNKPEDMELYANLGFVAFNLNKFNKAAKHLEKVLTFHSTNSQILESLGKTYFHQKKYDLAIKKYLSAVDICVEEGDFDRVSSLYTNIANTYSELNNMKEAARFNSLAQGYKKD